MKKINMKDFYKAMQLSGTVKRALKDDPEFRKWYNTKRKR